jgi:hypothetical protein
MPFKRICRPRRQNPRLKSLSFLAQMFRCRVPTKQFSQAMKPFFCFRADIRKQPLVISYQRNGASRLGPNRRLPMRTISFILGFALILAGPSIAGSSNDGLPGIGTFAYNASPAPMVAPTVIAAN